MLTNLCRIVYNCLNLLQDSILQTRVAKMFFLSDEISIFVPIL